MNARCYKRTHGLQETNASVIGDHLTFSKTDVSYVADNQIILNWDAETLCGYIEMT